MGNTMSPPKIDWQTADVPTPGARQPYNLVVKLSGEFDVGWVSDFAQRASSKSDEVRGGVWGEVTYADGEIRVANVRDGSESSLRDFLDHLVDQVNAGTPRRDAALQRRRAAGEEDATTRETTAQQMVDRFRDPT